MVVSVANNRHGRDLAWEFIKANWAEATEQRVTGSRPEELARQLSELHECHVVITLGERGLVCAELSGETWYVPAHRVDARDVCGAGDTVLAGIGESMARGKALREACVLATSMAAQQVSQLGVSAMRYAA